MELTYPILAVKVTDMLLDLPPEILRDLPNNFEEMRSQAKRAVEHLQDMLLNEGLEISDDESPLFR